METDKMLISEDIRDSFPDDWPDWVLHCLQRLDDAESPAAEVFLADAEDWVYAILLDIVKLLMPTANVKSGKQSGPAFLGATIGHQERLLEGEDSENAMEINLVKLQESGEKIDRLMREKLSQEQYDLLAAEGFRITEPIRRITGMLPEIMEQKTIIMQESISLAAEQDQAEKMDFFKGYSKALNMPLFDKKGQIIRRTNASPIHTMMGLFWREVDQMENLPTVYNWLKRFFPKPNLINWDQIRRMCNRKGLSLAETGQHSKRDKS